jgi:hypothetical protein
MVISIALFFVDVCGGMHAQPPDSAHITVDCSWIKLNDFIALMKESDSCEASISTNSAP